MRPLIGVSGRRWPATWLGTRAIAAMAESFVDVHFTDYTRAIADAGGIPVQLTRDAPVADLLDRLDAVVLSGGADVDPATYDAPVEQGCGPVEPERDAWELALLAGALERSLPVLAICRGLQLANVHFGGTLHQHLGLEEGDGHPRFTTPRDEAVHDVRFEPGSLASSLYGDVTKVNSIHHQSVDRLGEGLVVTGRSPDGTIEALERPGATLLAVQWHPESLASPDPSFTWLVAQAGR